MYLMTWCRVCLTDGIRMHCIKNLQDQEMYEKFINNKLTPEDGLPDSVCYICYSQLLRCSRFIEVAQKSDRILAELHLNGSEFASDSIKTLSRETILDLRMVSLVPVSNPDDSVDMADETLKSDVVKTELTLKLEYCSGDEHVIDDGTSPDQHPTVVVKKELIEHDLAGNSADNEGKLKQINPLEETLNYPHACDVCSKTFLLKTLLKSHIMTAHALERRYPCKTCLKKFTNSLKLNKHIKKKHPEEHPLACNACDRILTKISNWRRHIDTHIGVRPFTCDCCLKTFPEKGTLKRHMKIHNSVTLGNNAKPSETGFHFVCVTCGQGFERKHHLKKHNTLAHTKKNCDTCGEEFRNNYYLRIHIKRDHRAHTQKQFPCDMCGRILTSKVNLKHHLAEHTDDKPYTCDRCGKRFASKGNLLLHIKTHTGDKPYKCDICGYTFTQKGSLKTHLVVHTREKPFSCHKCGKSFTQNPSLRFHLKSVHNVFLSASHSKVKCSKEPSPSLSTDKPYEIETHIKEPYKEEPSNEEESDHDELYQEQTYPEIRVDEKPLETYEKTPFKEESHKENPLKEELQEDNPNKEQSNKANPNEKEQKSRKDKPNKNKTRQNQNACNNCNKQFSTPSALRRHMIIHSGEKPFKCDKCYIAFRQKCNMISHRRTHLEDKLKSKYVCDICAKVLSSKRHLQGHVLRVHTDKSDNITSTNPRPEYSCKLCGKSYLQKKSLTIHIRLHTGEKPYSCTLCRQLFARQSSLRRHVRIHSGETFKRSNPCEVCGKTFSQPCSLLKHRAVHSEQRPFGCDTCGKAFSRKDTLTYHIKLHTGIKPYNCKMCGMSFACTRSLSKHMKTHSEVKPYVCVVCYKLFAQRRYLQKHMKVHTAP